MPLVLLLVLLLVAAPEPPTVAAEEKALPELIDELAEEGVVRREHRFVDPVGRLDVLHGGIAREAVDRLETEGMRYLLLDLRNNPGGSLDAAIGVSDVVSVDRADDRILIDLPDFDSLVGEHRERVLRFLEHLDHGGDQGEVFVSVADKQAHEFLCYGARIRTIVLPV